MHALHEVLQRIDNAAARTGRPPPRLLAVAKTRPATAVAELAAAMRHAQALRQAQGGRVDNAAFGENYVHEALAKQSELHDPALEWHLIGHLQSNKAADAAVAFDWVQTIDRAKLVADLARFRPVERPPLNVLIQVNIDDETSKHGCRSDQVTTLAAAIAAEPRLRLRGLMAIPAPSPDPQHRRDAFRRMRLLFEALAVQHPQADTLSMGMSEDLELAIAEGATLVRVGTALFGPRSERGQSHLP